MKKIIALSFTALLLVAACKSKKETTASAPTTPNATASMDEQLAAVKARFPDATKEELLKGQAVYTGPCTNCHGTKEVTGYTEEKLLKIVDNMSLKAKISPEEKQALIRFALGVRATAKK